MMAATIAAHQSSMELYNTVLNSLERTLEAAPLPYGAGGIGRASWDIADCIMLQGMDAAQSRFYWMKNELALATLRLTAHAEWTEHITAQQRLLFDDRHKRENKDRWNSITRASRTAGDRKKQLEKDQAEVWDRVLALQSVMAANADAARASQALSETSGASLATD